MDKPSESAMIAEEIREGTYFDEAHRWYRTLYIGPLSERVFFLIISLLAGFTGIISVMAVSALYPLTSRPGLLIANERMDDTFLELVHLRGKGENINVALREFFVQNYVMRYEGYSSEQYDANLAFIQAHSDESLFRQYSILYGNTNPQSPAAILGDVGKRLVTVNSLQIDTPSSQDAVPLYTANIAFTTELIGLPTDNKTGWTATLQFYYSDLAVTEAVDAATGKIITSTQDPQFKVVSYAVHQSP